MNMTKVLLIEDDIDIVENLTGISRRKKGFREKRLQIRQAKALQMLEVKPV